MTTSDLDNSIDLQELEVSLLEHHRSYSGPAGMQSPGATASVPTASPTPSARASSVADELEERLAAAAARFGPSVTRSTARNKWAAVAPLTSATASHANVIDIASAFRGGDLSKQFQRHVHSSAPPESCASTAVPSPQPSSFQHLSERQPLWVNSGAEISEVVGQGLSRPSLTGHTPKLDSARHLVASPPSSPHRFQMSMDRGLDITQTIMEAQSTIIDECSNARASLRQLSEDVNNFDSGVQQRIQKLRMEVMQAKQLEEVLAR